MRSAPTPFPLTPPPFPLSPPPLPPSEVPRNSSTKFTRKQSITSPKSTHLDDWNGCPFLNQVIAASGSAVTIQSIVTFLPMITSLFLGGRVLVHLGGTEEKRKTIESLTCCFNLTELSLVLMRENTLKLTYSSWMCNAAKTEILSVQIPPVFFYFSIEYFKLVSTIGSTEYKNSLEPSVRQSTCITKASYLSLPS